MRVTRSSLLLLTIEHFSTNKLLKILAFSLKSVIKFSWCSSCGMQEFFLFFRKVFNIDQYDFWLVLGPNTLFEETEIDKRTAEIYHYECKICMHDF